MEPQSKESKRDPTIGSSEGNDEKDNECCAKAEGGEEAEDAKTEQAENEMEQSEAESEEKSLQMIREDFEQMRAVYAYRLAKNAGKNGADLYPQGYSSVEKRALRRYANKYLLEDTKLYFKASKNPRSRSHSSKLKAVCSLEEAQEIFTQFHDSAIGGHVGFNNTEVQICSRYKWKGITAHLKYLRSQCKKCYRTGQPLKNVDVELQCIEVTKPWQMLGIDLMGAYTTTNKGNKYIFTCTDYFTKWVEAYPIPDKTAKEVTQCLVKLFCRHGSPEKVLTDRGREFANELNAEFCRILGVKHKMTAAYHPQTNGLDERTNQNIKRRLEKLLSEEETQEYWDELIDPIIFSIRTTKSATTQYTPFQLLYGREALRPVEIEDGDRDISEMAIKLPLEDTIVQFMTNIIENKKTTHEKAKANIKTAQETQKKYYKKRKTANGKKEIKFKIGQKVLLFNARKTTRKGDKLGKTWTGPYEITEIVGTKHVFLDGKKIKKSIAHLKPWNFPEDDSQKMPSNAEQGNEEYCQGEEGNGEQETPTRTSQKREHSDDLDSRGGKRKKSSDETGDDKSNWNKESAATNSPLKEDREDDGHSDSSEFESKESPFPGKVETDFFEEPVLSSDGEEDWPRTGSWKATINELSKERETEEAQYSEIENESDYEEAKPKDKEENEKGEEAKAEPRQDIPDDQPTDQPDPPNNQTEFDTEAEVLNETGESTFVTIAASINIPDDDESVLLEPTDHLEQITFSTKQVVDSIWAGNTVGYIESKVSRISITDVRLLELKGKAYISDEIIDAYLVLLSRDYSCRESKILVIGSCLMTEICNGLCYKPKLTKIKIEDYDIVLGGYNHNRNHWNLVVLRPKEGIVLFLNSFGELKSQIEKIMKNWRLFWRNRVKHLNAQEIQWNFSPMQHPKQMDGYNCGIYIMKFAERIIIFGDADFPHTLDDLDRYRREIAEHIIDSSDGSDTGWCRNCGIYKGDSKTLTCTTCGRWIHFKCKGINNIDPGEAFECASCIKALINEAESFCSEGIQGQPEAHSSPVSTSGTKRDEKKQRSETATRHNLTMLKTSSKTRAVRCESCKSPFKEKSIIRQRFMVGHYGSRPFFKKSLNKFHHGTRNYYYCVRRACLLSVKDDITGKDINITGVENELLKSDLVSFEKNGITINV